MRLLTFAAPVILLGACMLAATVIVALDRPYFHVPVETVERGL